MSFSRKSPAGSPRSAGHESRLDPEDVFEQIVQDDETICPRCFRAHYVPVLVRVPVRATEKSASTISAEADAEPGETTVDIEEWQPTDNVDVCFPQRVHDLVANANGDDIHVPREWRSSTPQPKRHCECGAVDGDGTRAPLGKTEAIEHACRISNRLREAGVAHDRETLKHRVYDLKTTPETAARDEDNFAEAVAAAVRTGRSPTTN